MCYAKLPQANAEAYRLNNLFLACVAQQEELDDSSRLCQIIVIEDFVCAHFLMSVSLGSKYVKSAMWNIA